MLYTTTHDFILLLEVCTFCPPSLILPTLYHLQLATTNLFSVSMMIFFFRFYIQVNHNWHLTITLISICPLKLKVVWNLYISRLWAFYYQQKILHRYLHMHKNKNCSLGENQQSIKNYPNMEGQQKNIKYFLND